MAIGSMGNDMVVEVRGVDVVVMLYDGRRPHNAICLHLRRAVHYLPFSIELGYGNRRLHAELDMDQFFQHNLHTLA